MGDPGEIRDHHPAFWTIYGQEATIAQAAWHLQSARSIAEELSIAQPFEQRLREVIAGARLEVEMEASDFTSEESLQP